MLPYRGQGQGPNVISTVHTQRSEIERLKALLLSRSNESSSTDVVERNGANLYSSPSSKVALRQALVLHNNATGL
ncbi:hypothetical protein Tco_1453492 [Tanacetum coccineum]